MRATDVMIAMWVRVARSFSVVLVLVRPLPIVIPFAPIVGFFQHIAPVLAVSFVVSALAIEYTAPAPAVSYAAPAVPHAPSLVFTCRTQFLSPL